MKVALISTSTYPSDQGLRSISSSLKKANHETIIIFLPLEENYKSIYKQSTLNQLREICKNYDIIGIASYASTSIRAAQIADFFKDKKVIWGGIHATLSPETCIEHVDYVCRGEAEEAIVEFINKLEKNQDISKVKNFWIKKNNKIIKNEVRNYIENLDTLPPPDYNIENHYILEKNKIIPFKERHLNGQIFFQTERGCPNACTYCLNKRIRELYQNKGKIIRANSPEYVVKEMKQLKNKFKSLAYFDIRDETLLVRPLEEIKRFSELYKKEVGIRFKCLADPPTMNEEKLKLLIGAGLTDIIIGIQSGSHRICFDIYKRYIKPEQVIQAAEILNKFKNKICVMYDIMASNPYETKQDILDSINLIIKLPKPFYLSVNNLVFFLGSDLYNKAKKDKIIKSKKDTAFNLNYWDRWKHIKLKKKEEYLNLILNLMRGACTEKRYGLLPAKILKFLLKPKVIEFNRKHKLLTYMAGFKISIFDFLRENILKPIFRKTPTSFKVWYDRTRYKV